MAGKSFAIVEIDGAKTPWAAITNFSGGETNPKTREVPEMNQAGTMREEPTGGVSREPIEITFTEREDEGILLDDAHEKMTKWRDEPESGKRRKNMTITFFKDAQFTKQIGRINVIGAWPKVVSNFELDRASDDPRSFTATITHLGTEYKGTGKPTGLSKTAGAPLDGGVVNV